MSLKDHLLRQLNQAREMSERFLADFETPEQWVYQVCPGINHALWFAGHMAMADNFFTGVIAPDRQEEETEAFEKLFGMGSQPTNQADDYPSPNELLNLMRGRRETLLSVLEGMNDKDLEKATPEGTPDMFPDYASVFELATWHEGLHAGQISVARRALGADPVFGPQAAEAEA